MLRFSLLCALICLTSVAEPTPPWGFFGHRRINRLATFTLPPEMMPFFRASIDYLAEHAVDPDKRRYASEHEAVRHYIDLDRWGSLPFPELPRTYVDALMKHAIIHTVNGPGDTVHWRQDTLIGDRVLLISRDHTFDLPHDTLRQLWYSTLLPALRAGEGSVPADSLRAAGFPEPILSAGVTDRFSESGILPYYLAAHHRQLTQAFVDLDADRILQLSAEIGHYIGDAYVPLHTTENYNGQLTGQTGIHAFWESRLPELFADEEFDYFVGAAEYVAEPNDFYWDVVLGSHALVDSVLHTERRLREAFPADRQWCTEERLGRLVNTQCTEFARAWSEAMDGMVEQRFRAAIHGVGSVWYSCWVDAGQPDLGVLFPTESLNVPDEPTASAKPADSRPHE
ncbi:zinc dependent phospholipase C family protein [Lewinella sp. JB7]|uniref:zinc dependent phospholipase C family protein n=1 Tax=Lewinella sp. JB7 TaxID=2962887 RepID=UPI0020CA0368|nr:zinc dependent phospholipase C family protein [Lewinella sp. JB7]MCP9235062.1 zinc dependent phospholipase C family protein [Lewinella sp. JB7]